MSRLNAVLLCLVAIPPVCVTYIAKHYSQNAIATDHYLWLLTSSYRQHPVWFVNVLWLLCCDATFYLISLAQVYNFSCTKLDIMRKIYESVRKMRAFLKRAQVKALRNSKCHASFRVLICLLTIHSPSQSAVNKHATLCVHYRFLDARYRDMQDSTWLIDPYWTLAPPLLAAYWLTHPTATSANARQIVSTTLLCVWAVRLTHSYFRRERWQVGAQEDWRYRDMRKRYGRWWPLIQV